MQLNALPEVHFAGDLNEKNLEDLAEILLEMNEKTELVENFITSVTATGPIMDSEEIQKRTAKILEDFGDSVFSTKVPKERPIRGPFGEATIEIKPGAQPVKQRPYRIQGERREAWTKLVNKLIEDGKLEDGVSAWSSPSFPVPKKKPGEYRFVVDYRALNDATITDAHPLPRIEDLLQKQGQYRVWTVLDMKDGYHQVPLKKRT